MIAIPTIETERTIMRGWDLGDVDAVAAWMADPEVMRHLGGAVDRPTAWRAVAVWIGHWQLRGYGLWAVQRRRDGAVVGRIGLWNPAGWPGVEVGWTLARGAWGSGLATECARAAMDWGWTALPELDRLVSLIDPDNDRSRRVAGRLGMEVVGTWHVGHQEPLLYARPRPATGAPQEA